MSQQITAIVDPDQYNIYKCCALIILHEGTTQLLAFKIKNTGLYSLPSGIPRNGETAWNCAQRAFKEQTGQNLPSGHKRWGDFCCNDPETNDKTAIFVIFVKSTEWLNLGSDSKVRINCLLDYQPLKELLVQAPLMKHPTFTYLSSNVWIEIIPHLFFGLSRGLPSGFLPSICKWAIPIFKLLFPGLM